MARPAAAPSCIQAGGWGRAPYGEPAAGADLDGGLPRVPLPEMSGFARMRAIEPGIPVVAWSGKAGPAEAARLLGVTGNNRNSALGRAVPPTLCPVVVDFPGPVLNILLFPKKAIAGWCPVQLSGPLLFNKLLSPSEECRGPDPKKGTACCPSYRPRSLPIPVGVPSFRRTNAR
jgi:hypothetical protein